MSNELAKALKQKPDAMFRSQGQTEKAVVIENASGEYSAPERSDYTQALASGKNIHINVSGTTKTINAIMNLIAGDNIEVSEPDPVTGAVNIKGTIGGKDINIAGLSDGYVLSYDLASDTIIFTEKSGGGTLAQATETELGGVKAKEKTTESAEIAIDPTTGKLYGPSPDAAANGLPPGGTAAQIPYKIDGTDYNVGWMDPPSGGSPAIARMDCVPPKVTVVVSGASTPLKGTLFYCTSKCTVIKLGGRLNTLATRTYRFRVHEVAETSMAMVAQVGYDHDVASPGAITGALIETGELTIELTAGKWYAISLTDMAGGAIAMRLGTATMHLANRHFIVYENAMNVQYSATSISAGQLFTMAATGTAPYGIIVESIDRA